MSSIAETSRCDVLVVDDDAACLDEYVEMIQSLGFRAWTAKSAAGALEIVARIDGIGIVVTDFQMPDMDGIGLVQELSTRFMPEKPIVPLLVTGYGSIDLAVRAMHLHAIDFLSKPVSLMSLREGLERASARWSQQVRQMPQTSSAGFEPFDHDAFLSATRDGFLLLDAGDAPGAIVAANPAYCRMSGFGPGELGRMSLQDLDSSLTSARLEAIIARAKRLGAISFSTFHRRKDQSELALDVTVGFSHVRDSRLFAFLNDRTEMIEQTRQLVAVSRSNEEHRRKAMEAHRMLVNVGENTLREIGRELHDNIGQLLAGAVMLSESAVQSLRSTGSPAANQVERIAEIVSRATSELRTISKGLFPADMISDTLPNMLHEFIDELRGYSEIEVHADVDDAVSPMLTAEMLLHVGRIVQEATANVIRHSRATAMSISCSEKRGRIRVEIADNGIGIPARLEKLSGMGIGLRSMRARATEIGGTLQIRRRDKSSGTSVVLTLPSTVACA